DYYCVIWHNNVWIF
nr:immunoglobulin light chain junction region [Macaca mulatta]MOX84021.1 immunoglobulin light chain junction region [Macaca mulatta]